MVCFFPFPLAAPVSISFSPVPGWLQPGVSYHHIAAPVPSPAPSGRPFPCASLFSGWCHGRACFPPSLSLTAAPFPCASLFSGWCQQSRLVDNINSVLGGLCHLHAVEKRLSTAAGGEVDGLRRHKVYMSAYNILRHAELRRSVRSACRYPHLECPEAVYLHRV